MLDEVNDCDTVLSSTVGSADVHKLALLWETVSDIRTHDGRPNDGPHYLSESNSCKFLE